MRTPLRAITAPSPPRRRLGLAGPLVLGALLPIPLGLGAFAQQEAPPWSEESPALPPASGRRPVPLAALPPLPSPIGLPALQSQVSCPSLQRSLTALVAGERDVWSISVADPSGRLLADINGLRPRSPASNQKLVSTAFALDHLGPDHRLSTQMWRLRDGTLRLTGQGDPDLALPQLQRFARLALNASGGVTPGMVVKLQLAEESSDAWWPAGWKYSDRSYAYGAPITRLAVTSNAIEDAVMNPPSRLQTLLKRSMAREGADLRLSLVSANQPLPRDAVLVHEEPSTTMHGLISLANTESHNFTAEVLLRQGAGTWFLPEATRAETSWLAQQGLPMQGVRIADGSGLDRTNRLTSRFLAALLLRMDHHPYARYYRSSLAIAGQRGTLRHLFNGTSLDGRVYAKTGTLSGVRAISGFVVTNAGPRYFSAISNGATAPNQTIGAVLGRVQSLSLLCNQTF